MEATGAYWKPVWHMLEVGFDLVLANAQHIRNVPGRKTDVSDAMGIADLLAHGLIRSSFVPPAAIQELRDLTRTRKQLVREIFQHSLRIQRCWKTPISSWAAFFPMCSGAAAGRCSKRSWLAKAIRNGWPTWRWVTPAKSRRAAKKAILAVAASMLTAAYFMLR